MILRFLSPLPKKRSQFSRLQLLMPFGFSPVGAEAQAGKRLIVELSLEQGQGEAPFAWRFLRFFFDDLGVVLCGIATICRSFSR